ncbi:MAG TPA: general secretion pathway protein GspG [Deltaproteobacteria bacterium]|nr:general secretion pathway protein GspG [Deltaproteobacteria bacterium]HCY11557.1 general secretion pathway protein GspG [Deltaproteobacteria bacterium]
MTAHITKTGKGGFTLIEMLIVMTLIGILAGIAVPLYQNSVTKSREAVLKEDIYQLREAIDKHYADNGAYPESLRELSNKKYIRSVPVDPFTNSDETWIEIPVEGDPGVYDVKSGSRLVGTNGVAYSEW